MNNVSEVKKCQTCGVEMLFAGENDFRTGGTSGGWKLLFGEWAEIGEGMFPLLVYVCPQCGKVELYASKRIRQKLIQNQTVQNQPPSEPESEFPKVLRENGKKETADDE